MSKEGFVARSDINSTFTSAFLNVLLQVCSRALTFGVNAIILRYIHSSVLGIINVRLLLLYSTVSFISHEPFRKAGLRIGNFNKAEVINVLWLSVPWTGIVGFIFGFVWTNLLDNPETHLLPQYYFTVGCILASCFLESLCEPLLIFCQALHMVKVKLVAESFLVLTRTILFGATVLFCNEYAILGFGISQLISSLAFLCVYIAHMVKWCGIQSTGLRSFYPVWCSGEIFDHETYHLTCSFLQQSVLKQILTEGERYIMSVFQVLTFSQQGVYDVVSNLGSLAARFILAPVEEASYLYFSQALRESDKQRSNQEVQLFLSTLLNILLYFGIVVCVYSLSYSRLLLYFYAGKLLSEGEGPILLKGQSIYVVFLAINGILEAFVFAAMSQQDVKRYNRKMIFLSVLLLISSLLLTRAFGSLGFIMMNSINMSLRIIHSISYINTMYKNLPNPLFNIHLDPKLLFYLACSALVLVYSEVCH